MQKIGSFVIGSVWKRLAWITAAAVVLGMWSDGSRQNVAQAAAPPLTIGFVYVGPKTDYGYNQAHAQGAAALAKLPGVKILEEEKVPETMAVQKTMESMINLDGATVVFPTSFGYFDPHILKDGGQVPERHVPALRRPVQEGKHPANVGSYFGYIDEAQYVAGIVAAMTTKSKKLGVHRRQADPAGAAQHQRLHARGALGRPEGHDHRHLHR